VVGTTIKVVKHSLVLTSTLKLKRASFKMGCQRLTVKAKIQVFEVLSPIHTYVIGQLLTIKFRALMATFAEADTDIDLSAVPAMRHGLPPGGPPVG
jgi:hypothetical protein